MFGAIFATIIAAVALYCVAKRKQLLPSLYRRTNSTSHLNLQADLNGTCGNTDNVQNQGVLKRPAEVGECALKRKKMEKLNTFIFIFPLMAYPHFWDMRHFFSGV